MSTRAYVQPDIGRFSGVAIYVVEQRPDGASAVMEPVEPVMATIPEGVMVDRPSLRIPEEMARALLDALSAHFGGTSDVQTLRSDYLAERKRVDKMIEHLVRPVSGV